MRPLVITGFLLLILAFGCRQPESAEEVETRISKSEVLQRLDKLCTELPKPEGFKFVRKSISGNSYTVSLSYDFRAHMSYDKVYDFYRRELTSLGWKPGPSGYSEKENQQVSVSHVEFGGADYSLYCAETVN